MKVDNAGLGYRDIVSFNPHPTMKLDESGRHAKNPPRD